MKTSTIWIIIIIVVLIGVVIWISYGMTNNTSTNTTINTSQTSVTTTVPSTIQVLTLNTATSTKLGTYLVDPNGMTLYTFNKDTQGVSNCTGTCLIDWPPYVVSTFSPNVGNGIVGVVQSITRTDGSIQVTYKGMPLYFWKNDINPGDTTGNGVGGFSVAKP